MSGCLLMLSVFAWMSVMEASVFETVDSCLSLPLVGNLFAKYDYILEKIPLILCDWKLLEVGLGFV